MGADLQVINHKDIRKMRSLDEYRYNIIDLNNEILWRSGHNGRLEYQNDYQHIGTMIENATSKVIIKLPQNISETVYNRHNEIYEFTGEIKNNQNKILGVLKTLCNLQFSIEYEVVRFQFEDTNCEANFYFTNVLKERVKAESIKSKKPVIINQRNVYLTTLDVDPKNYKDLIYLLDPEEFDSKEIIPSWVYNVDYKNQLKLTDKYNDITKKMELLKIEQKTVLDEQKKLVDTLKVLYTSGRELEKCVNRILCELFDVDISKFVDTGNEDFLFENESVRFVFEIKGVSKNLEKKYLSQLLANSHNFADDKENKAILIICHNREKELDLREKLHPDNVALAEIYDEVVMTTYDLLKIYENNISIEKLIEVLSSSKGQVTINDFCK